MPNPQQARDHLRSEAFSMKLSVMLAWVAELISSTLAHLLAFLGFKVSAILKLGSSHLMALVIFSALALVCSS